MVVLKIIVQHKRKPKPKRQDILKELDGYFRENKPEEIIGQRRLKNIETRRGGLWYGNVHYHDGPHYCDKWTPELRERVRAFFFYKCLECGKPQEELDEKLHVHHVWYNKKLCCDDTPRTLVPLCASCHAKTNFDRDYWSEHFQLIVDSEYGGRCWFTRDEYENLKRDEYGRIHPA